MSIIPGIEVAAPGADGDEQRVGRVAEARAGGVLEVLDVLADLVLEAGGAARRRWPGTRGRRRS